MHDEQDTSQTLPSLASYSSDTDPQITGEPDNQADRTSLLQEPLLLPSHEMGEGQGGVTEAGGEGESRGGGSRDLEMTVVEIHDHQ